MNSWVNPLFADAAIAGSSVTVVLNSLRQKNHESAGYPVTSPFNGLLLLSLCPEFALLI